MNKDELAQYYYGCNYDVLPKDKQEHIDTQMIVHEEDDKRNIKEMHPRHPDDK